MPVCASCGADARPRGLSPDLAGRQLGTRAGDRFRRRTVGRVTPPKLVLCVIDAMAPTMLERAIASGGAPTLRALVKRGQYISDCVAAFPSVTPVCAASIVTGTWQDQHLIPGMNWYHRFEQRYVEYGSSFRASQRFGLARQLIDTVYNMNGAHLAPDTHTVFETLDDIGVRTAGTTYLMYRGRHRHVPQRDTTLTRIASTLMRHPVMGPRELFYADIFASQRTSCRSTLGMPGVRDQHSGCVGAHLVEHDLFDFLLLSFPDNDWHSHRVGPEGQLQSIALADEQLARVMAPAGGVERFLDEHAVIVMADHSQAPVSASVALQEELSELDVLLPRAHAGTGDDQRPSVAVCPSQRAAMVYVLSEQRRSTLRSSIVRRTLAIEGVELVMWLARDPHGAPVEGALARAGVGELRFCPDGDVADARGRMWSVEGELAVLDDATVRDGRLDAPHHPDALGRAWSALACPTSGEVLLSAAPGYEFVDWGSQAHLGGGSHGSLRGEDSLAALILCGVDVARAPKQWTICDVASLITRHFGA
jgi:predicted AlkP superfamily pyrophosphatase or phosphodiesterase